MVVADAMEDRAEELVWLEGDGVRDCRCPATPGSLRLAVS